MRFSGTFLAMLFALSAVSSNAAVTGYYRFETDNGVPVSNGQTMTVADDSSGNNRNGVAVGALQYATTPFTNPVPSTGAANLSSLIIGAGHGNSEQEGILLSGANAPILAPTFTVEAYFRLNSTDPGTGDSKAIFRVRDAAGFPFMLTIGTGGNQDGGGTDAIGVVMNSDTLELYRQDLSVNTNYHVAVTCDGTNVSLYLDGSLVTSGIVPGGFSGSGTTPGMIGNDPFFGTAAFQGNIDEVRISDVALSPSQFLDTVPEPASLSLMGLSGMALLRRRPRGGPVVLRLRR